MRGTLFSILGLVATVGVVALTPSPSQAMDRPSFTISPTEAKVGDRITVRLEGWTSAAVTLQICGNLGLRGAPDCDQVGGQGIGLSPPGPSLGELKVTRPPVPCPCIVRATSATIDEVQTAPIVINGIPVDPVRGPGVPVTLVDVSVTVSEVRNGVIGTLRPLLGGRSSHELRITLRNKSSVTLSKVTLGLSVGRTASGGQPVDVPPVEPLKPAETRVYVVPATVVAPTWGHYVWDVTVDGAGPEVDVKATTAASSWLLTLLLLVLGGDVVVFMVVRLRRRRTRRAAPPASGPSTRQEAVEEAPEEPIPADVHKAALPASSHVHLPANRALPAAETMPAP